MSRRASAISARLCAAYRFSATSRFTCRYGDLTLGSSLAVRACRRSSIRQGLLPDPEQFVGDLDEVAVGVLVRGYTLALHRARDDGLWFPPDARRPLQRRHHLAHLVSVDLAHLPAEAAELLGEGEHVQCLLHRPGGLEAVVIDDRGSVVQPIVGRVGRGLPHLPLVALAVPHDAVDPVARAMPPCRSGQVCPGRLDVGPGGRSHGERQAQPQGAAAILDPRRPGVDMRLEPRSRMAVRREFLPGEMASYGQGGVDDFAGVPFGDDQPVPLRPLGIFRVMTHPVEEQRGDHVGRREAASSQPIPISFMSDRDASLSLRAFASRSFTSSSFPMIMIPAPTRRVLSLQTRLAPKPGGPKTRRRVRVQARPRADVAGLSLGAGAMSRAARPYVCTSAPLPSPLDRAGPGRMESQQPAKGESSEPFLDRRNHVGGSDAEMLEQLGDGARGAEAVHADDPTVLADEPLQPSRVAASTATRAVPRPMTLAR